MLARTLRPHAEAQALHVDFKSDENGYPMLGFIFMVDEFRRENGATRFVPGSHKWSKAPDELTNNPSAGYENQSVACGADGSMIIYNGSIFHGHTANVSETPRRSIQGAFIRRGSESGFDFAARMRPETLARISPLAKYLLAV
jgi:ectoine hydroxylase-related dioxygenase (phytanoyl-CoA dioxygenase family)